MQFQRVVPLVALLTPPKNTNWREKLILVEDSDSGTPQYYLSAR